MSVENEKYYGNAPLPDSFAVSKKALVDLIPKDMLEIDWLEKRDRSTNDERDYKNWLLDNTTLSSEEDNVAEENETEDIFKTDRGKWCLKVFSDVILIEAAMLTDRDSSLASSGIAAWGLAEFDSYELFHSYAESNPHLGLNAKGMFIIANWLLRDLIRRGLWLDKHTRRHVSQWQQQDQLKEIIGKGLNSKKGLAAQSKVCRILKEYLDKDDYIDIWSQTSTWKNFIEKSPLEKYVQFTDGDLTLKIKERRIFITGAIDIYRSSKTQKIIAVPRNFPLVDTATGIKGETWQLHTKSVANYYSHLYQRKFSEEARLIRGQEHSGMLKPEQANRVIEDFVAEKINTLVATPTLEMGVDLPDLPIVIHRSVPPDASNYAQRTGRAGRDPKRALLLTHCGYGNHDLVFYEHPEMMVAGEILPPGLPCENAAIIRRHVQGLVLELLAITRSEFGEALSFKHWQDLVNLNDIKERYEKIANDKVALVSSEPNDWRAILQERKTFVDACVQKFIENLHAGLWKSVENVSGLERQIQQTAHEWATNFAKECEGYCNLIKDCLDEVERLRNSLPRSERKEIIRKQTLIKRTEGLARNYLQGHGDNSTYPITYLCSSGFLPNFDFPGVTTRFIGTIEQYHGFTRQEDATMTYDRGAEIALREFAPEQKIYGRGFVYEIDRYVARGSDRTSDNKAWGVCLDGCTQLTEPDKDFCRFCEGELVKHGQEKLKQPKLIEIQQAHGHQKAVISDSIPRRRHHYAVQEVRRIGMPKTDEAWALCDNEAIKIKKYLTPDNQIETATIISVKVSKNNIEPVFKEMAEGNMFSVKLKVNEKEASSYEPFIPTVFGKGQAITLTMPLGVAMPYLNKIDVSDEDFYTTFGEFFIRATYRVLRLRKRSNSLKIVLDKIHARAAAGSDKQYDKIDVMLLDTEEGGSGIIELIWDYWDDILMEAKRLVEKDCCAKACYRCVWSYDNQKLHNLIDKSIFAKDSSLFDFLRRFDNNKKQRYECKAVTAENKPTDSYPEEVFKKFLAENFSGNFPVQESVSNVQGQEVTRPDFVLDAAGGEKITVFIDGAKWHASEEKMHKDIDKRNTLAMQGRRVLSLPAKLLVPQLDYALLKEIVSSFEKVVSQVALQITKGESTQVKISPKDIKKLSAAKLNNFQPVNRAYLQQHTDNFFSGKMLDTFRLAVSVLGDDYLPVALRDDVLLFAIDGKEVFQDNNSERWAQYFILTSLFVTIGYRILTAFKSR